MNGNIFLQQNGSEIIVVACGRHRNELFCLQVAAVDIS